MNTLFRNGLMMLAAGAFAASCADYNETNNFYAEPGQSTPDAAKAAILALEAAVRDKDMAGVEDAAGRLDRMLKEHGSWGEKDWDNGGTGSSGGDGAVDGG